MKKKNYGIYGVDSIVYRSGLRGWNPFFKIITALGSILFCLFSDSIWVWILIIISMSGLSVIKGKIELGLYFSLLTIPFVFLIMGGIAIALETGRLLPETSGWNLGFFPFHLSYQSLGKAVKVMIRSIGAITAMYMMILSTPVYEVIMALRKLGIPKLIVELMNMVYRFIFILLEVQQKMKIAAESRLGFCDFKTSCISFGSIAANLLILSIKKANAYYDALLSRGYEGELLFLEEEKPIQKKQIAAAFFYFIVLAVVWGITKEGIMR